MKLEHLKAFNLEIEKAAVLASRLGGKLGAAMNIGFGAMGVAGAAKASKGAGEGLGKTLPMNLGGSRKYEAGQFAGQSMTGNNYF